jgi:hypothetical protein
VGERCLSKGVSEEIMSELACMSEWENGKDKEGKGKLEKGRET